MRKNITLLLLSVLLVFSGCAYFNIFFNAKLNYRRGYRITEKQRTKEINREAQNLFEKSIEKSLKLLEYYPESKYVDDALLLLGKCYYYQKRYLSAQQRLNELINEHSQSEFVPEAKLWLARIDVAMSQFDAAENKLNRLLNQEMDGEMEAVAFYNMGKLYDEKTEYEKAVDYYLKSLDKGIKINKLDALYSIAANYDTLGRFDEAERYYKRLLKNNPYPELAFETQFRIARIYQKTDRVDKAIRAFNELMMDERNKKRIPDLKLEISHCLNLQGDINQSITSYLDLTEDHPKTSASAAAYYFLGKYYEQNENDYEMALEHYSKVYPEFRNSVYADSAEVRKRDLQRYLALNQVIYLAMTGQFDEEVSVSDMDIDTETAPGDTVSVPIDSTQGNSSAFSDSTQNRWNQNRIRNAQEAGQHGLGGVKNSDSTDVTKPQIVENPELKRFNPKELDRNRFLLAELYLFRFSLPDSAAHQYRLLLDEFPESPYASRAIFNMAFIAQNHLDDKQMANLWYQRLVDSYPKSPLANEARTLLGIDPVMTRSDSARTAFQEVESRIDKASSREAYMPILAELVSLQKRYNDTEIGPKALYNRGWLYLHRVQNPDSALSTYQRLIEIYPESPYAKAVRPQVDYYLKHKDDPPATAALADSLIPSADSLGTVPPDSLRAQPDSLATYPETLDSTEVNARKTPIPSKGTRRRRIPMDDINDEEAVHPKPLPAAPDTVRTVADSSRVAMEAITTQARPVGGVEAIQHNIIWPDNVDPGTFEKVAVVQIHVTSEGVPVEIEVLNKKDQTVLNNVLKAAINKIRFLPAERDNQKVDSWITLNIQIH